MVINGHPRPVDDYLPQAQIKVAKLTSSNIPQIEEFCNKFIVKCDYVVAYDPTRRVRSADEVWTSGF